MYIKFVPSVQGERGVILFVKNSFKANEWVYFREQHFKFLIIMFYMAFGHAYLHFVGQCLISQNFPPYISETQSIELIKLPKIATRNSSVIFVMIR
jgi:hypothetical protein